MMIPFKDILELTIFSIVLGVMILVSQSQAFAQSPRKIALSIAVGKYQDKSGWENLGSNNDADLLEKALLRQSFTKQYIKILRDEKATKVGIQKAFDKYLLNQASKGDKVIFHFSGHGQQIIDDDEDELDGYDEALVPYDSPMRFKKGIYEGQNLLRDDELNEMFSLLRQKLGPEGQLLVLLDACHSGTATRGYGVKRGSTEKMSPLNEKPPFIDERGFLQKKEDSSSAELSPMIVLSASSAQELNYEYVDENGKSYGPLTYAFVKAFSEVDKLPNYRALFDQLQLQITAISPQQSPQAEGPLDLSIFNGQIVKTPVYVKVLRVYNSRTILIDGGTIHRLYPDTKLKFYPIGTNDTTGIVPIAEGIIIGSVPLIAEVELSDDIPKKEIRNAWGFVSQQNYGNIKIGLKLKLDNDSFRRRLLEKLKEYPVIQIENESPDLILEEDIVQKEMILSNRTGIISSEKIYQHASLVEMLIKRILVYIQADYLRQLDMQSHDLMISMKLIPVTTKLENDKYIVDQELANSPQMQPLTFKEGNSFIIELKNEGNSPAYFGILDIQPDNQFQIVLPNSICDLEANDLFLNPGQTKKIDCIIDVYPPYGTEMLKLISTRKLVDWERGLKGDIRGRVTSPFEKLIQATYKDRERGAATPTIPPSSANIFSLIFEITP